MRQCIKMHRVAQNCHYTTLREVALEGDLLRVIHFRRLAAMPGPGQIQPFSRMHAMTNDPFSASVIPFEVPEQMRAFAEKGVSHARDSYAKFKDVAETHNGTIEAVFAIASKGASEYSAKLMEIVKANTTTNLEFAQE